MPTPSVEERVVLVDLQDNAVGEMGKMQAHRKGVLHRAISVFVFNSEGQMLLQRRAETKYHCGGQWSNTACSHPRPGEVIALAAGRRLWEEMKLACDLDHRFSFVYRAELDEGIVEHEFDHVFTGISDHEPTPDPDEVDEFRWANVDAVRREMTEPSGEFTPWFRICFERAVSAPGINQSADRQGRERPLPAALSTSVDGEN